MEWETELQHLTLPTDGENAVRMVSLFNMPQVMELSATELKYVRKEILPLTELWHKAFNPIIDNWMDQEKEKATETEFKQAIELGKQIEKVLENSTVVANQSANMEDELKAYNQQLCLGYFPTSMIWSNG